MNGEPSMSPNASVTPFEKPKEEPRFVPEGLLSLFR